MTCAPLGLLVSRGAPHPRGEPRGYGPAPLSGLALAVALLVMLLPSASLALGELEQISLKTFEEMREVERYQLKIAEKHYTKKDFKVALAEYEKFLALYEKSKGAPYAQLMWSHCQMQLKKPKTAIREGFQSVIDYWPDSREATLASYCIGDAYRKMGEVKQAQAAFRNVVRDHPEAPLAVRAKVDLLHYARLHEDQEARLELLKDLCFKTKRTEATNQACVNAAHELATIHFHAQEFEEGRKALATSYKEEKLFDTVYSFSVKTINHLLKDPKTTGDAAKLGDKLITALRVESANQPDRAKEFLYRVASLHGTLGRPSEVWKTYLEIEKKFGRDDTLRGHMADYFKARDRRDDARRMYQEYEDQVAGLKNIASMWEEDGDYEKAIATYIRLIEINGENADGYQGSIAKCYETMSEWKKAINTYRQIDDFPGTYFAMANCHRKLKEYKEAIVLYNQCKVVDRVAPQASLQIGFTYEESGEKAKAIRTFQLTCKRYPKSGEAGRAHAHLQNKYNINVTLGGAEDE